MFGSTSKLEYLTVSSAEGLGSEESQTIGASQSVVRNHQRLWGKILPFITLAIPTVISSLLLASISYGWTESGRFYRAVTSSRASTQMTVQIISYLLGLIQV